MPPFGKALGDVRQWLILEMLLNFCFAQQQKGCPVRMFSNRLLSAKGPEETSSGLSRHFDAGQSGTTETPWGNNSALLFSAHYEPDAENSLMANFKCQFIFVGAPDERVQIIFHYFRLKQQFPLNSRRRQNMTIRCEESDHLSAHVLLADRMSKIHDFCGDELPAQLMSAKNVLTLTYVLKSALITPNPRQNHRLWVEEGGHREGDEAKDEAEHFGWIAEYRFIGDFGAQPPEAISPIGDRSKCSFTFNGTITTTGNVWSPNYPGFYPRNVDCQYVFVGRAGQKVYITFEYFDIEGFGHCEESTQSDFVLFSNYQTRDRTNRRFCGHLKPKGAVQSESNYFRMHFHTNGIFDGTGFFARYQFLNEKPLKNRVKLAPSSGGAKREGIYSKNNAIITLVAVVLFLADNFIFNLINIYN